MAIRITIWIQGLFSGFVTIGSYGKWLTDINLLLILIRQMAALVRRALAEVCPVPVPLVMTLKLSDYRFLQRAALQTLYQLRQFRPSVCPSVHHTPVLCQNDGT